MLRPIVLVASSLLNGRGKSGDPLIAPPTLVELSQYSAQSGTVAVTNPHGEPGQTYLYEEATPGSAGWNGPQVFFQSNLSHKGILPWLIPSLLEKS
jgi:hypothetical protein